jgi:hypothetical protein
VLFPRAKAIGWHASCLTKGRVRRKSSLETVFYSSLPEQLKHNLALLKTRQG